MKALHLLNPGTYLDRSGNRFDATPEVLKEIAASYDPALHEAPLVVGHPTHDGPAHGWVKSLCFGEGGLEAVPDQVSGDLQAAVGAGHLKKLSAAFWPPAHPKNPTPGKWHLRHVGFLGAMPPAAKGLRPIQLADGEEGLVELSEPDMPWFMHQVSSAFRAVRDFLIGEKGMEAADKVLPAYTVESLERIATQAESGASSPAFSEGDEMTKEQEAAQAAKEAQLKAKEVQLSEQETGLAERERAIAAKEAAAQKAEAVEFVEGLAAEGKVLPREVPALVEVLSGAPAATAFELSEGEGESAKKVQTTAGAFLRDFLKGLPKRVEFREVAAGGGPTVDLSDADAITAAAQKYQAEAAKEGRAVSASQAVQHVTGK